MAQANNVLILNITLPSSTYVFPAQIFLVSTISRNYSVSPSISTPAVSLSIYKHETSSIVHIACTFCVLHQSVPSWLAHSSTSCSEHFLTLPLHLGYVELQDLHTTSTDKSPG